MPWMGIACSYTSHPAYLAETVNSFFLVIGILRRVLGILLLRLAALRGWHDIHHDSSVGQSFPESQSC